jgi:phosphotransferase system IIB component
MATLEELIIELKLDQADLTKGLTKVQQQLNKTESASGKLGTSVKRLGGIIAGSLAVGKLVGDFKQAIDYMDDMSDAADRVGISSEAFSKLAYAAKITEVPIGTLEASLRKMQLALVEASNNADSKAAVALRKLHLEASNLRAVGADEAIALIADALNKIKDPAEKAAYAQALFSKGSRQLNDLLKEGGENIRAYGEEAKKFGVVIDDEASAKAEEFKKTLVRLETQWQGMVTEMAKDGVLDGAMTAIKALTDVVGGLYSALSSVVVAWKDLLGVSDKQNLDYIQRRIDEKSGQLLAASNNSQNLIGNPISMIMGESGTQSNMEGLQKELEDLAAQKNAILQKQSSGQQVEESQKKVAEVAKDYTKEISKQADEMDKLKDKAESYYQSTYTEAEKVQAKIDEVRELQAQGAFETQEQYTRVLGNLETELANADDGIYDLKDGFKELGDTIENRLGDELVDAMKRGENAGQALWKSLQYAAIDALGDIAGKFIKGQIGDMFGGGKAGGGGLGNLFGKIGGSLWDALPSFDKGGFTGYGGMSGGVDGKGGFPAVLHPNEMVMNKGQMGKPSGGQFTQNVNIFATDDRQIDQRIQNQIPAIARYASDMVEMKMGSGGTMSKQIGRRL